MLEITETWLDSNFPSSEVEPGGFTTYRIDCDPGITGKLRGGGMSLLFWDH